MFFAKTLRFAMRWLWNAFLFVVLVINFRLYLNSPLPADDTQLPPTIFKQLAASRADLESGSPDQMQAIFPEGYVFSYLFYGLTWVEVGLRDPEYREQAIREALWAVDFVDTKKSRSTFSDIPPDHGMFYSAWHADLVAGIVMLQKGKDEDFKARLRRQCDDISLVFRRSKTPFPPSYEGLAWACDSFPGLHAMAVYDHVTFEGRYEDTIQDVLRRSAVSIDRESGMIAAERDWQTGHPRSPARATNHGIILRTLPDISPALAREKYVRYRERLFKPLLGIPSVLEYQPGTKDTVGDIDSGPLVFGRSFSSNVMAIGLAQIYDDKAVADAIAQTGEAISCPLTYGDQRTYAFGLMPIGEQMVAYSYVARPWFATTHKVKSEYPLSRFWRVPFHGVSLLIFTFAFWLVRKRKKRNNLPSQIEWLHEE